MNIQTERLDNHTARFTVELDTDRLEQAKQAAAKKIAKRVNIPGFRKGKVPYKILLNYVGEGALLEDAIEILGNDIYKEALDQSGVDPYGPGQLEDFVAEPQPTFTFVVPLQPTVDLGDYRSTRQSFSEPMIEDDQVNKAMRALQEEQAVVEESHQPVVLGNRVNVEMYAAIVDENGEIAKASAEEHDHDHDEHEHDHDHKHGEGEEHDHDHGLGGNEFIHEHNAVLSLGEENEEPAPGFKQALVGANIDETREFEVTYPEDSEEWGEELAGKKAKFKVTVKKIETMTLPSLNDELAARVTEKEEKPLSLLELRMRVRENLQTNAERQAKSNYAAEVLDKLVDKATIGYPDALVEDQIDSYMERLDRDLRQQGLTLEDYVRVTGKSKDDLRNDYRDVAMRNVKRSLVLREVMKVENIEVPDSKINQQIDTMLLQFGEQAESLRPMLDTPAMRENVRNDLLEQSVLDRIAAIAKGEAPELNATIAAEESTETATSTEVSQEGESA
ncbi:MAG: trigger factor [Chloroflexota bacterium]